MIADPELPFDLPPAEPLTEQERDLIRALRRLDLPRDSVEGTFIMAMSAATHVTAAQRRYLLMLRVQLAARLTGLPAAPGVPVDHAPWKTDHVG